MSFSKKKFESFSQEHKGNVIVKLIYKIYENWTNGNIRQNLILELIELLNLTDKKKFSNIASSLKKEDFSTNIQKFDKIMMPFLIEKKGNILDNTLQIYKKDFTDKKVKKIPVFVILDNLRSVYNVGSVFRSAECFGIKKIYCCGYTPTPNNKKIAKSAMGTEKIVEWEHHDNILDLLFKLKKEGIMIYSMELTSQSKELDKYQPEYPCAFVFGNEALGVSEEVLKLSDEILYIPLSGLKNSLNVASTAAIVLYQLSKVFNERKK